MKRFYQDHIVLFLLLIIPFSLIAQPQSGLDRVEPPFWWAGMNDPELQLLVYGKDISKLNADITYEGVIIERITKVASPNYLFIDLKLSSVVKPGVFQINFRDDKRIRQVYDYELKSRHAESRDRIGFNPSDVIYLITPDRFANGDLSNDEFDDMPDKIDRSDPFGRHGGDIQGMIDHLDYIADMGFTGIWLNPVLENNMEKESYHGYATTDFYKVDPRFGTNELYLEMSQKARTKGIKLIMDMIVNHCGSRHWWMEDLPSPDWLNSTENYVQTNHRKPTTQDPYGSAYDKNVMVNGWFVPTMPDMNQKNPLLATYLIQNAIWWIEYADLSGIRQDTYPYADREFLTNWTCAIMNEYPNFNITGEEWSGNPNILAYWQQGHQNPDGYESCLPSLLDFPIQSALWQGLNEDQSDWSGLVRMYEMLANDHIYADPFHFITFPDNHDMDRFFTAVGEDFSKFKNGLVYILTMRGIPQLYYGTELLFTNSIPGNHGLIRKDYPGGWEGDEVNAFSGKGLTELQKQARDYMTKLLQWRKSSEAIHNGKVKHFVPYQNAYVYFRYLDDQMVMVVINRNTEDIILDLSRLSEVIGDKELGTDIISGTQLALDGTLHLQAGEPLIIEIGTKNNVIPNRRPNRGSGR